MQHFGYDLGMIVNDKIVLERLTPVKPVLEKIYETSKNYPSNVLNLRMISYNHNNDIVMNFIWETQNYQVQGHMLSITYNGDTKDFSFENIQQKYTSKDFIEYFEKQFTNNSAISKKETRPKLYRELSPQNI